MKLSGIIYMIWVCSSVYYHIMHLPAGKGFDGAAAAFSLVSLANQFPISFLPFAFFLLRSPNSSQAYVLDSNHSWNCWNKICLTKDDKLVSLLSTPLLHCRAFLSLSPAGLTKPAFQKFSGCSTKHIWGMISWAGNKSYPSLGPQWYGRWADQEPGKHPSTRLLTVIPRMTAAFLIMLGVPNEIRNVFTC